MRRLRVRDGLVGVLVVGLALTAGCSGDDKSSGASYCDAVQQSREVMQQVLAGDASRATLDEFARSLTKVSEAAPTEIWTKYIARWGGDEYAQDDIDVYNKKECGLEPLGVTPTTSAR